VDIVLSMQHMEIAQDWPWFKGTYPQYKFSSIQITMYITQQHRPHDTASWNKISTPFPKIHEPPSNSKCLGQSHKQVPHWWPTIPEWGVTCYMVLSAQCEPIHIFTCEEWRENSPKITLKITVQNLFTWGLWTPEQEPSSSIQKKAWHSISRGTNTLSPPA
jgi:hypothetical protein